MKIKLMSLEDCQKPIIKRVIEELTKELNKAAKSGDTEKANGCWRELEATRLSIKYIGAFDKIKNKEYRDAWCDLEECEIKFGCLEKNSTKEFLLSSRALFIIDKVSKLQSLYPYRLFASPGFIVGYHTCNMCGHKVRPRSRCEHTKGKVYNGELCIHIAHDIEFFELSLVTNPVQKYSVIHNDEPSGFSLLNCLMNVLENAFEEWDLTWTTKRFPIERFSNVLAEDKCPCKSNKVFEKCCMKNNEIEIPHVDFYFPKSKKKDQIEGFFPY
ncbi:hypothetical protein WLQ65_17040 [Pseudoalteromonas piscicida]|uniref:hypothetical protein n=1 Tax=Pseudoalteromonas piscicida TaxID=43662 RepID=UPI0030C97B3E